MEKPVDGIWIRIQKYYQEIALTAQQNKYQIHYYK